MVDIMRLFPSLGEEEASEIAGVIDCFHSRMKLDESHLYMFDGNMYFAVCILADSQDELLQERLRLNAALAEFSRGLQKNKARATPSSSSSPRPTP